ncbi:MAG: type II secretion system GspH family protein [Opitutaceae bacterium]|jgi:prepilin-type N-terminal cleavage/methylation domain-containing protein|nr:type II secretion system GspH family protein [Opitutaceae bacterium]
MKHPDRFAFTLIELLTVIAIIGILAALAISGVSAARKKAQQVRCIANLHTTGVAILAYTEEHKGFLPGPTGLAASGKYTRTDTQVFGWHLAAYLDCTRPENLDGQGLVPYLLCPARPADHSIPSYIVQCTLKAADMSNKAPRPFGYQNKTDETGKPVPYTELDAIGGPSRIWALIEADQMLGNKTNPATGWNNTSGLPGSGWYSSLPVTPSHGAGRPTLYFDARVALTKDVPPPLY